MTSSFVAGERASLVALDEQISGSLGGVPIRPHDVAYAGGAPGLVELEHFNINIPPVPDGEHALLLGACSQQNHPGVTLIVGPR